MNVIFGKCSRKIVLEQVCLMRIKSTGSKSNPSTVNLHFTYKKESNHSRRLELFKLLRKIVNIIDVMASLMFDSCLKDTKLSSIKYTRLTVTPNIALDRIMCSQSTSTCCWYL